MGKFQLRAPIVVLTAVAACVIGAGTALADAYDDAAATCGGETIEQPFAGYGDGASYFRVPGSWALAKGTSVTSTPVCISSVTPTIRFFTRVEGKPGGLLRVEAVFKNGGGRIHTLPVAMIGAASTWAPTEPLRLRLTPLQAVGRAAALAVAFRFTAVGGNWSVDRLYVDPLKECC